MSSNLTQMLTNGNNELIVVGAQGTTFVVTFVLRSLQIFLAQKLMNLHLILMNLLRNLRNVFKVCRC